MKVFRRRRRENKTNYLKRIKMLKSGSPRIVLRKTNNYFIAQYVESSEAQDKAVFGLSTKILLKFGWDKKNKGSLKSMPASYFLGYLVGKKIQKEKLKAPILDFGLYRVIKGSKIQGFVKGIVDSGLDIKHNEKALPDEKRIKGDHLKNKINFEEIKKKLDK